MRTGWSVAHRTRTWLASVGWRMPGLIEPTERPTACVESEERSGATNVCARASTATPHPSLSPRRTAGRGRTISSPPPSSCDSARHHHRAIQPATIIVRFSPPPSSCHSRPPPSSCDSARHHHRAIQPATIIVRFSPPPSSCDSARHHHRAIQPQGGEPFARRTLIVRGPFVCRGQGDNPQKLSVRPRPASARGEGGVRGARRSSGGGVERCSRASRRAYYGMP